MFRQISDSKITIKSNINFHFEFSYCTGKNNLRFTHTAYLSVCV